MRYESFANCNKKLVNCCVHVVDVDTSIDEHENIKFAQNFLYLTELLHQQNEFKTEFEEMEVLTR